MVFHKGSSRERIADVCRKSASRKFIVEVRRENLQRLQDLAGGSDGLLDVLVRMGGADKDSLELAGS